MKGIIIFLLFAILIYWFSKSEFIEDNANFVSIVDIIERPDRYYNTIVTVRGKVENSINIAGLTLYSISDEENNTLYIKPNGFTSFAPMEKQIVTISGELIQLFKINERQLIVLFEREAKGS